MPFLKKTFSTLYLLCLTFLTLSFSPCRQARSWHRTTWATAARRCLSGVTVRAVGISCRSACASCTCLTATLACVSVPAPLVHMAHGMVKRATQSKISTFFSNVLCIHFQGTYTRRLKFCFIFARLSVWIATPLQPTLCVGRTALFCSLFISMRLASHGFGWLMYTKQSN